MSSTGNNSNGKINFISFLKQKQNKLILLVLFFVFLVLNLIQHNLYPDPELTADSGSYILSAQRGIVNGYRPIGYSNFMSFIHSISSSIQFQYFFQYWLNAIAVLLMLFSVKYLFKLDQRVFYVLAFFSVLCPSLLKTSNLLMSDSVFASFTLLFLISGIWMIASANMKNRLILFVLHCILLSLLFSIRYTALFYPIISIFLLLITFWNKKILVLVLSIIPIVIIYTKYQSTKKDMKQVVKVDTFSGFSGWAMANNAASIIPDIRNDQVVFSTNELNQLHSFVLSFPDSIFTGERIISTNHIWVKTFPFKQFMFKYYVVQKKYQYLKAWNSMGELLNKYGTELIKKYPGTYFNNFLLLNLGQIFIPFEVLDPKIVKTDKLLRGYFNYKGEELNNGDSSLFKNLMPIRQITYIIMWILFVFSIGFGTFKVIKNKTKSKESYYFIFFTLFILMFIAFSVISHPINNYRYFTPLYIPIYLTIVLTFQNYILKKTND